MSEAQTETPLVSITLLTYNHEEYIRQCLDGILMQKVNFKYEIIVGDDCSKDSTQSIVREYVDKYPDKFVPVLREKNLGVTRNLYDLLKRARGKYIAGLEGDDYWINENKLQIQVDFLNEHDEYIGCSHEVNMVDEYGQTTYNSHKYLEGCHWTFYKDVYTFEDFSKFALPGQGSTYLYRNIFLEPKYDYSIIQTASPAVGDMTLLMLLSAQGDWFYMKDKTMTCYRYVTSLGKENWASWIRTRNRSDIDFKFRMNLEEYARRELKINLDLSNQKYEMFRGAIGWYVWEPSKENFVILLKVLKMARPKWFYINKELRSRIKSHFFLTTVSYAIKMGELDSEDNRLKKSTWNEFKKAQKGKTIVAFGRGLGCSEFIRKYGKKYCIPCALDNRERAIGAEFVMYNKRKDFFRDRYDFVEVIDPKEVLNWDQKRFVVLITSTLYQDQMAGQLKDMGFFDYYSLGIMESKKPLYRLFWNHLKRYGDK